MKTRIFVLSGMILCTLLMIVTVVVIFTKEESVEESVTILVESQEDQAQISVKYDGKTLQVEGPGTAELLEGKPQLKIGTQTIDHLLINSVISVRSPEGRYIPVLVDYTDSQQKPGEKIKWYVAVSSDQETFDFLNKVYQENYKLMPDDVIFALGNIDDSSYKGIYYQCLRSTDMECLEKSLEKSGGIP
ncbi:MAG: hypothetical protein PHU71_01085 [Candidatus Gracilibacteria bacterium]|nr:hypothetical protein [Candidatus Gracilibacteria bacterium]